MTVNGEKMLDIQWEKTVSEEEVSHKVTFIKPYPLELRFETKTNKNHIEQIVTVTWDMSQPSSSIVLKRTMTDNSDYSSNDHHLAYTISFDTTHMGVEHTFKNTANRFYSETATTRDLEGSLSW